MRWSLGRKILILCGFTEKSDILGGEGFTKKQYTGGIAKKGVWIVCRFKRGWSF